MKMFCSNCGAKALPSGGFCGNCGTKAPTPPPAQKTSKAQSSTARVSSKSPVDMAGDVISGNGKHMTKRFIWHLTFVIFYTAILFFIMHTAESNISRNTSRAQLEALDNLMVFVIILYVVLVGYELFRMFQTRQALFTKIAVFEDAVKGTVLTGSLGVSTQEVNLPYNTIVNVDVFKHKKVVVHTQYAKYTCYAKNCEELRESIMERVGS